MSTLKTTYIQHPSAASPAIELSAEGFVLLPLLDVVESTDFTDIVKLTQAEYDALTPDASTLYVIVG
jgi:hypothetical protein